MGHRRLNSTMIYARVHNRTVADDYYAAMARIERFLDTTAEVDDANEPVNASERAQLLNLVSRLAEPQLDIETRLDLVAQMRCVLDSGPPEQIDIPFGITGAPRQAALASVAQL
jgi:hypothetical protein